MNCLIAACSVLLFFCQADADRDELEDRAEALFAEGDAALEAEQFNEALTAYREALKINEAIIELDPDDLRTRLNLSLALQRMARTHRLRGTVQYAIPFAERRLRELEALLPMHPEDAQILSHLSGTHTDLGLAAWISGELEQALPNLEQALRIDESLALADPSDLQAKDGLATALERLGKIHDDLRQYEISLTYWNRAYEIRHSRHADSPQDEELSLQFVEMLLFMADTHLHLTNYESYRDRSSEALALIREVLETDPENREWQYRLTIAQGKLGRAHMLLREYEIAEELLSTNITLVENLEIPERFVSAAKNDLENWRQSLQQCRDFAVADGAWEPLQEYPLEDMRRLLLFRCWLKAQDGDIGEVERVARRMEELALTAGDLESEWLLYTARAYGICAKLAIGWRPPDPYPTPNATEPTTQQLDLQQAFIGRSLTTLEKAIDMGLGDLEWLREDIDCAALHGLPEFEALLSRASK